MSAGTALAEAALAALASVGGLNGRYDGPPLQAACPFATVEPGPETDWGYKSGIGREVRLTVTLRDEGERPGRLRGLMDEAEAALAALGGELPGWRIVTLVLLRRRVLPAAERRWAGVLDYRARMLGA